jgi:hypothetical protein
MTAAGHSRHFEHVAGMSASPPIACWTLDRAAYTVTPVMSDGTSGPPLNLRGLFEQFQNEVL